MRAVLPPVRLALWLIGLFSGEAPDFHYRLKAERYAQAPCFGQDESFADLPVVQLSQRLVQGNADSSSEVQASNVSAGHRNANGVVGVPFQQGVG